VRVRAGARTGSGSGKTEWAREYADMGIAFGMINVHTLAPAQRNKMVAWGDSFADLVSKHCVAPAESKCDSVPCCRVKVRRCPVVMWFWCCIPHPFPRMTTARVFLNGCDLER